MSRPLKNIIRDRLWDFIAALLLSFSLGLLWSRAFLGEGHEAGILLRCAAFILAFTVIDCLPRAWMKAALLFAAAAAGIGLFFFGTGPVFGLVQGAKAMFLEWVLGQNAAVWYADELRTLFCLIFCAFLFSLVSDDAFGSCVFVFVSLAACPCAFNSFGVLHVRALSFPETMRLLLPGCAGLVMVLSGTGGRRLGVLIPAAVLALAAFLIIPGSSVTDPTLSKAARQLSDLSRDLFYTGENRNAFSLHSAGFMPLEDRLGGRADPKDTPVMRVVTDAEGPLYLKGASCDTYTGLSWQDTLSDRGYLFDALTSSGERNRVFGNSQLMDIEPASVSVQMLRNDTTTLYSPQRITSFDPESERMVLYFNRSGDLYITRDLAAGDRYAVSFLPLDADSASVQELIRKAASENDPLWNDITEHYLTVSPSVSQTVWGIAGDVTWGMTDPLEKALALRAFLKENYVYTLNAGTPGSDVDFVSWFLLEEGKGYCTFFASAMTVLCRMAGIPARYVTGFATYPEADGSCVITSAMGHAWTEIYLRGFGWLTIDATGSGRSVPEPEKDGPDGDGDTSSVMIAPSPSPESEGGEPPVTNESPVPSSPSPTPTPYAGGQTPSPSVSSSAFPSPSPDNETRGPTEKKSSRPFNPLLLIIFIFLACCALLVLRIRTTRPDFLGKRRPDRAALFYYHSAWRLAGILFGKIGVSETWHDYGARISSLSGIPSLSDGADDFAASLYAREHHMDEKLAREIYGVLWQQSSTPHKAKLLLTEAFMLRHDI